MDPYLTTTVETPEGIEETYDYGDPDYDNEFDRVLGLGYLSDQAAHFRDDLSATANMLPDLAPRGSRLQGGIKGAVDEGRWWAGLGEGLLEPMSGSDWIQGAMHPTDLPGLIMAAPQRRAMESALMGAPEWLLGDQGKKRPGRDTSAVAKPRAPIAGAPVENRAEELDAIDVDALDPDRGAAERASRLGFSWGKSVTLDAHGRPVTDSELHDPISGKMVKGDEAREGGHGGYVLPNTDSLPWGQLPESAQRDVLEQVGLEGMKADLDVKRSQARDPYGVERARAVAEAQEGAKRQSEEMRRAEFSQRVEEENAFYTSATSKLEDLKRRGLPADEYSRKRMEIETRHSGRLAGIDAEFRVGARMTGHTDFTPD